MQFGLGLRAEHYQSIIESKPTIDWFEIISEDYLIEGGYPLHCLEIIRAHYPLSLHGVSLSIGSADSLNWDYLKKIKHLAERVGALWISDHLCWTGVQGINTHDLLPLPYTQEAINHVVSRIQQVQDYLDQPLVLENVSSYLQFNESEYSEADFLAEVANRSGCLILLDINNVYVSAFNHGFDAKEYLNSIPSHKVKQFHLAGHKKYQNYIVDTHDEKIDPAVLELYKIALKRFGAVATSIERDDQIPPLSELLMELTQLQKIACSVEEIEYASS